MDLVTDAELLAAHVAGDRHAFGDLVKRHYDQLWRTAMRTSYSREDAADALQEALLKAHRSAADFRADASVSTWLHRIVVNACLDRIRRNKARPAVTLDYTETPEPSDPRNLTAERETAALIERALAALPPDQRAAIVAVDVEGYSVNEAAELLGVPSGTVKSRCARGRLRLAQELEFLRDPRNRT